jgi:hypothetical protein
LLDDHWGGSYERGFEAGRDSALADVSSGSGQSVSYGSQQADVGLDGSYQDSASGGSGFGGGDVDFAGNYDTSGGSDPGGGAFDFGGFESNGCT